MSRGEKTVLLLGGSGLLGSALRRALAGAEWRVSAPSHQELNVLDFDALRGYLSALEPELIFNCVAYTQVDRAESEPALAMRCNRDLPQALGAWVRGRNSFLVHYSTDFVFNGQKAEPYLPGDPADPLCVYGATKLAGEEALQAMHLENCAILRTAWLYGPGGRNFVRTILGVCAMHGQARVVDDQAGSPTYSRDLARWSVRFARAPQSGIFHAVNSGKTSWHGLAAEAVRLALPGCTVHPINTAELTLPARRPAYSVLDNSGFSVCIGEPMRPWTEALHDYLLEAGFLSGHAGRAAGQTFGQGQAGQGRA